jgi:hypothetical protein
MNLWRSHVSHVFEASGPPTTGDRLEACYRWTYFLKILSRVLNLEPSSAGFSTGAFEAVTAVVEAGRAVSAGRSVMVVYYCGEVVRTMSGCVCRLAGTLQ